MDNECKIEKSGDELNKTDEDDATNKKAALEHLRSMKFAKKDPFSEASTRDSKSFVFSRTDRLPLSVKAAQDEHKQSNDRKIRNRYDSLHHSSNDSLDMQRRQQKSTMFLLLQNEQPQNYPHNQSCKLPGILKDLLPTTGPFKQKIEALLAFPEDEMFSLPLVELKTLLLYAADISQEQERLLNGRKGQLKELDQMIEREGKLIEDIFKELPTQLRPDLTENSAPFNSNGSTTKASVLSNQPPFNVPPPNFNDNCSFSQMTTVPLKDFTQPPPTSTVSSVNTSTAPNSSISFSAPPPNISSTPAGYSTTNVLSIADTSLPPPPIAVSSTIVVGSSSQTMGGVVNASSSLLNIPAPNLSAPPPPINFNIPPPNIIANSSSPMHPNLAEPIVSGGLSSNVASSATLAGASVSFSVPPPALSTPSNLAAALDLPVMAPSTAGTTGASLLSSASQQPTSFPNLSVPPPQIHKPPPPSFSTSSSSPTSQITNILASVAASLQQHQSSPSHVMSTKISSIGSQQQQQIATNSPKPLLQSSAGPPPGAGGSPRPALAPPRPLMSIEQPPPLGFLPVRVVGGLPPVMSSIRSLASLVPLHNKQGVKRRLGQNKSVGTVSADSSPNVNAKRRKQFNVKSGVVASASNDTETKATVVRNVTNELEGLPEAASGENTSVFDVTIVKSDQSVHNASKGIITKPDFLPSNDAILSSIKEQPLLTIESAIGPSDSSFDYGTNPILFSSNFDEKSDVSVQQEKPIVDVIAQCDVTVQESVSTVSDCITNESTVEDAAERVAHVESVILGESAVSVEAVERVDKESAANKEGDDQAVA